MRNIKAFTLIEVMISIFIFTTSMLAYMSFHAHAMSVLFDNESAQFAHSLAFNLIEELNAMSAKDFKSLVEAVSSNGGAVSDSLMKNYFGNTYPTSPFTITKTDDTDTGSGSYEFHRSISVTKYDEATHVSVSTGSFLSTLYEVDVEVRWPKRGKGSESCETYDERNCNRMSVPLVRTNVKTFKSSM